MDALNVPEPDVGNATAVPILHRILRGKVTRWKTVERSIPPR
jgi:hypothetical protein